MTTLPDGLMLTEDVVVNAVAAYLERQGWRITQKLTTLQQGYDIVAQKDGQTIRVEAKGGTTSKETARDGKPFTLNQAKSHIGRALLKAAETLTDYPDHLIAIALPLERAHWRAVKEAWIGLERMGFALYWVSSDQQVFEHHQVKVAA